MGRALSLSSSSSLTFLWLLFCLATVATAGCVPARLPSPAHDSGHASVGSVPHATPSARARARPSGGGRCQRRRASRAPTPVPPPGRCGERVGEGGGGRQLPAPPPTAAPPAAGRPAGRRARRGARQARPAVDGRRRRPCRGGRRPLPTDPRRIYARRRPHPRALPYHRARSAGVTPWQRMMERAAASPILPTHTPTAAAAGARPARVVSEVVQGWTRPSPRPSTAHPPVPPSHDKGWRAGTTRRHAHDTRPGGVLRGGGARGGGRAAPRPIGASTTPQRGRCRRVARGGQGWGGSRGVPPALATPRGSRRPHRPPLSRSPLAA